MEYLINIHINRLSSKNSTSCMNEARFDFRMAIVVVEEERLGVGLSYVLVLWAMYG